MSRSFQYHVRHAPNLPNHTCPAIDEAVGLLEKLRGENADLRAAAEYWKDAAEQLGTDLDDMHATADALRDQIHELENPATGYRGS
jgi:hypothetical protein